MNYTSMGSSLFGSYFKSSSVEEELKLEEPDIISVSEFIKNQLYFVTYKNKVPTKSQKFHYFKAKDEYVPEENAEPISRVSLGSISQFIKTLNIKLSRKNYSDKIIVNYSIGSKRKRSNDAVLIGVYAITHLNMSPEKAAEKLSQHTTICPLDSLNAVQKAINLGFINFKNFNGEDFYSLDKVKLNWVVPNKILMFSGPLEVYHCHYMSPGRYIAYFRHMKVQTIIRLSHLKYDANPFVDANIPHYDLNIAGSVPTDKVFEIFLELIEGCEGVVVVHCRELLGRAGCLVAAYLIKHYGLTTGEAVAWVRICTSDCILEAQKTWLKNNEASFLKAWEESRQEDERAPRWTKGICAVRSTLVQNYELLEQSEKEDSSSEQDVTAQVENEIRLIETDVVESKMDHIENMA